MQHNNMAYMHQAPAERAPMWRRQQCLWRWRWWVAVISSVIRVGDSEGLDRQVGRQAGWLAGWLSALMAEGQCVR